MALRSAISAQLWLCSLGKMKARKLIAGSVYDPAELKAVGKAFDDAWDQVASQVSTRPEAIEAARLKLAEIVLTLAKGTSRDPEKLTQAAVRLMLASRSRLR
jgi:hypothetical protein